MEEWKCYPQCRFPNWTPDQVENNRLLLSYDHMELCMVHKVDISHDRESNQESIPHVNGDEALAASCWNWLQTRVSGI